ncbi:MAG TPA: ATP-binding protein [Stellaceae bacterium]|nr:ATP-binding protein [Stellaceae bacterium]
MRLIDLPRTSSFRLALLFLALFGISSAVLFGFLYLRTQQFLLLHVDTWLIREAPEPQVRVPEIVRRFDAHLVANPDRDHVFALYDGRGQHLAGDPLPMPTRIPVYDQPFDFRVPVENGRTRFRGIAHRLQGGELVLVAQNMYETREFDEAFVNAALWCGVLTMTLGLAGALIVGAGTVRRFDAVALAIQRIVSGDLSRRLPSHGTSGDLDRLAHVVNGMLDDIERLMQDVKGVCDGIAHDLRTPLTRMLAGLERARRRASSTDEYATAIDDAIVEMRSVLKTFSALLRIAEVEDGARHAGFSIVDLETVARDVTEFYEPLADEKDIVLSFACAGAPPFAMNGDSSLLFEAIGNLVDNAIKFTPPRGRIAVDVTHRPDGLGVSVTDTGIGIGAGEREAVLRRFHRSEKSRHTPGNGLGLSLVAAVARLHGMSLTIEDAVPGCRVALLRPLSSPREDQQFRGKDIMAGEILRASKAS